MKRQFFSQFCSHRYPPHLQGKNGMEEEKVVFFLQGALFLSRCVPFIDLLCNLFPAQLLPILHKLVELVDRIT